MRKSTSFICPICETVISGKVAYTTHIHKHHVQIYKCEICPKEFKTRVLYKMHLTRHEVIENRKHYICDRCGRVYVDKRNLINHLQTHMDIDIDRGRYRCTACGETYCEGRLLKNHIRKHHFNLDNIEPNYNRKKINDIWIERVKHTKVLVELTKVTENVLKIKRLDFTLKNNDIENLVENSYNVCKPTVSVKLKNQYNKDVCKYCNKVMLKKSLHKHILERHMNERKYECDVCKHKFKRQYQLNRHNCGRTKTRMSRKLTNFDPSANYLETPISKHEVDDKNATLLSIITKRHNSTLERD